MQSRATELWLLALEAPGSAPSAETSGSIDVASLVAPILSTGVVGVILIMILFRIKVMPTYVHDAAEKAWNAERERLTAENAELKLGLKEANKVYTEQVIPTLTRVLDSERELVDLRRDEASDRRRRGSGSQ